MKKWTYVIFAKDGNEHAFTVDYLKQKGEAPQTHPIYYFVHLELPEFINILQQRLDEHYGNSGQGYKNNIAVVYAPSMVESKIPSTPEHERAHSQHKRYLKPHEYKRILIESFGDSQNVKSDTFGVGITVWEFYDAPEEYRNLSTNGGDEDWLVLIPAQINDNIMQYGLPYWIESMDSCREPQIHKLPNGDTIVIGAHA